MTLLDDAEEACGMGFSYDIPANISDRALMEILVIQIWRPKEFLLRVEDVLIRTSDDGLGNSLSDRKRYISCLLPPCKTQLIIFCWTLLLTFDNSGHYREFSLGTTRKRENIYVDLEKLEIRFVDVIDGLEMVNCITTDTNGTRRLEYFLRDGVTHERKFWNIPLGYIIGATKSCIGRAGNPVVEA